MKIRCVAVLLPLIAGTLIARADLTIQHKHDGIISVTRRIKGDKVRVDSSLTIDDTELIDLKTGDTMTLNASSKVALKRSGTSMAGAGGHLPGNDKQPELKATGKAEKIGGCGAEVYTWSNGTQKATLWVARDYPDYARFKEELLRLISPSRKGAPAGSFPDFSKLPGMVVKAVTERSDGQKVTTTLESVKMDPLDDSLFVPPGDYQIIGDDPEPPAVDLDRGVDQPKAGAGKNGRPGKNRVPPSRRQRHKGKAGRSSVPETSTVPTEK